VLAQLPGSELFDGGNGLRQCRIGLQLLLPVLE
jgi:hypothetical protein